jgi:nickel/cobalt transporter (NicO) family protein
MGITLVLGASSGALHAVTAPDHVLSLGPVALGDPRRSWRIGVTWGLGHAAGTLLLALPVLLLSSFMHVQAFAAWGDRLAGAVLIATATWSWLSLRKRVLAADAKSRNPFWVGLIHGVSGAGSLLLVLPAIVSGSTQGALFFLAAFAAGSTLAMAALTWTIAKLGSQLDAGWVCRVQVVLLCASVGLGGYWLVAPA